MPIDLRTYSERIGFTGDLRPSAGRLRELHLAHATHVPFENIDVLLGRPIRLDIESLWKKLVEERRGGYCFEQNTLFAAVLESIGFPVTRLAARVRLGAPGVTSRGHMLLAVEADGQKWLVDVGFGGEALLLPIPWRLGETAEQFDWKYRIVVEGQAYVLQDLRPEGWLDLYSFNLEEQYPVDYEVANYHTSTHPNSFFRKQLMVHLTGPSVRHTLVNRRLIERRPQGASEIILPDDTAVVEVLASRFGLHFPVGTRFPYKEETS
jgi:N-hydroxyarylamine O-acetyltransferase